MSIPARTYSAPSLRTVQHKSEIIDREGLDDVQCDLDFAPQRELPAKSGRMVAIAMLQATIVGTIAAWGFGGFVVPFAVAIVPLPIIASVVLVIAVAIAVDTSRSLEDNLIRLLKNIWLTLWFVAAILSMPFLMQPIFAALWLLVVAMPVAVFFAYRFTTFGVHWITGHPLGDGDVMLQCRDIWQHRYENDRVSRRTVRLLAAARQSTCDIEADYEHSESGGEMRVQHVLRAIRSHDYGFLWCFIAVATALTVTWCNRESVPASIIGLHAVVSVLFGLFIAAIVRCGGKLPLQLMNCMLLRWFTYDWDAQATPWMFQSPCGEMLYRRRWFWAVLATVAVAFNHLAGAYAVVSVPLSQSLAIVWPAWTQPILMTLITAACCLIVPTITLTFIVCIIAGPALRAFDNLYSE